MSDHNFFRDGNLKLVGSGPLISRERLGSVLNYNFSGRDKFDEFYVQRNGGYFLEPAFFYRDMFYSTPSSDYNRMYVEGFYFVPLS